MPLVELTEDTQDNIKGQRRHLHPDEVEALKDSIIVLPDPDAEPAPEVALEPPASAGVDSTAVQAPEKAVAPKPRRRKT